MKNADLVIGTIFFVLIVVAACTGLAAGPLGAIIVIPMVIWIASLRGRWAYEDARKKRGGRP